MIVQLLLSERIGGAETLARSLKEEWDRLGVPSRIEFLDDTENPGVLRRAVSLRRRLQRSDASVVIAHSALPSVYARLTSPRSIPVISVLHSAVDDYKDRKLAVAEHLLRRRTPIVIAVSAAQATGYRARFKRNIIVIRNGISNSLPGVMDKILPATPRVVTVARIAEQKNPSLWLAVMNATKGLATFQWFGPMDLNEPVVAQAVSDARRADPAVFPGAVQNVGHALSEADLFFHPADREAASIGLLEAGAMGLPIVCSAAVSETLPPELRRTEFVTGDALDAEATVRRALTILRVLTEDARQAAPFIRDSFSITRSAEAYLRVAEELARRGRVR